MRSIDPSLPALEQCCSSSPPGQVRGDVPSLGLACAWEWTPQGIHGHHISHPSPTLLLTPIHHNMHREQKGLLSPVLLPPALPGDRDKTDGQGHQTRLAGAGRAHPPACPELQQLSVSCLARGLSQLLRKCTETRWGTILPLPSGKPQPCTQL